MLNQADGGSGGGLLVERWGEGWFTGTNWFANKSTLEWPTNVNVQVKERSTQKRISICDFQELHEYRRTCNSLRKHPVVRIGH